MTVKVTGFLSVFESKLDRLIEKIKDEYQKPKAERDKTSLKSMAKEAKKLRKLVKEMQETTSVKTTCPNCGHKFKSK